MPQKSQTAGRAANWSMRATAPRALGARTQLGWWLTGAASFCLTGAVVLGVVREAPRHGAELALEIACVSVTTAFDRSIPDATMTFAEAGAGSAAWGAWGASAVLPGRHLGSPGPAANAAVIAQALPVEPTLPGPATADADEAGAPVLVASGAEEHASVAIPLPPSRPRELLRRVRLASVREPIEFQLAVRSGGL